MPSLAYVESCQGDALTFSGEPHLVDHVGRENDLATELHVRSHVWFSTKPTFRLWSFSFRAQVLVADSDDEVVDHASLLNSFGNDNTNIITPVPRMHSIKPEWDEDVSADSSI